MKKLIIIALLTLSFTSCSLLNKEEETDETNSWTTIEVTNSWETVNIDTEWNVKVEINGETINTNPADLSVEKDIENIIENNEETSKENVTEEEILDDIDTLINDIINSAENG